MELLAPRLSLATKVAVYWPDAPVAGVHDKVCVAGLKGAPGGKTVAEYVIGSRSRSVAVTVICRSCPSATLSVGRGSMAGAEFVMPTRFVLTILSNVRGSKVFEKKRAGSSVRAVTLFVFP